MIRAVLFDLDNTLLRLNLEAFVARYIIGASKLLARVGRMTPITPASALIRCFIDLESDKRQDDLTNEELYNKIILERTGIPLDDPEIASLIDFYEREVVSGYKEGIVCAEPRKGARKAVDAVWSLELVCALATNPTFSLACDKVRMSWAGLSEIDFAAISTFSNTHRCKPSALYYEEFAGSLGLRLDECLMVGNDNRRDFAKPENCGLRTAYVGHARPKKAVWRGSMEEFAEELPDIVKRLNNEG